MYDNIQIERLKIAAGTKLTERTYWLDKLSGVPVKTGFPFFHIHMDKDMEEKAADAKIIPGQVDFTLAGELYTWLIKLSTGSDIRLHIVLASLLTLLLGKYTGSEDIVIGTPVLKSQKDVELINTVLVLINRLTSDMTFKELLIQVKQTLIDADKHRNYPMALAARELNLPVREDESPFFDVALLVKNIHDRRYLESSKPSVIFSFLRSESAVDACVEYIPSKYPRQIMTQICDHFRHLVELILAHVEIKIRDIDLLLPQEKKQLLVDFNNTGAEYPREKTIHQLFAGQVEKTPDHIAVIGPHHLHKSTPLEVTRGLTPLNARVTITYRELNQRSNQLAHLLQEKAAGPDTIIGIMVERSLEMVTGILSILKAGGAYLPIDPDYPEERIDYMLSDSGVKFLVTTPGLSGKFKKLLIVNCQLLIVNERPPNRRRLNKLPKEISSHLYLSPAPVTSLAYIIYTSGSTGMPKGVAVEHSSVVNILTALQREYPLGKLDTYLLKTSYMFDVSVTELFGWFPGGGRLAVLEKGGEKDPAVILAAVERHFITHINFVPSMFRAFAAELEANPRQIGKLAGLKYIFLAGEALLPGLVNQFKQLNTAIVLENIYGPTEGTVYTSWYSLDVEEYSGSIPIGKPMQNIELFILDQDGSLQPIGVAGELSIAGCGVARGYLNQPGLTAEKFDHDLWDLQDYQDEKKNEKFLGVQGPFFKKVPGRRRLYKTGDRCRWLPDGNIEYLGRMDTQVKVRGFRVELGEIESRLLEHPLIKEVVITARDMGNEEKHLCAYFVSRETLDRMDLKEFLARVLPGYMIPAYFVQLDKIPVTANGKVDRKALPLPAPMVSKAYEAPRDEIERKLVGLWSEILGVDHTSIGIADNFFQLGGHSLNTAVLASRVHQAFQVELPLSEAFKRPTVRKLAEYIRQAKHKKYSGIEPVEKREYYPLSSAQKRLYFLQQMDPGNTAYNMPLALHVGKEIDKDAFEAALKKLIARHESLRTSFIMVKDIPFQKIHDKVEFEVEYYSPAEAPGKGVEIQNSKFKIQNFFIRSFDLSRAPLIRSVLVKHPDSHYTWVVDIHHIVSDGTSHMILAEDFMAFYAHNGKGLAPLKLQYNDFSQWQNRLIESGFIKSQEEYWLKLYRDSKEIPRLNLPTDYKRPEVISFRGDVYCFSMEKEEVIQFKAFASANGGTLYMNFLAALDALFYKYTDQSDIIIGTGIAGRTHADLQGIIGMFVNTLAMRNHPQGEKTYEAFLKEVITGSVKAFENQGVQFEELVDKLDLKRDASRNPLFDILMVVQNFRQSSKELSDQEYFGRLEDLSLTSKFDITFFVYEEKEEEKIVVDIQYYTDIFKEETIIRLVRHFKKLINEVIANPLIKLNDIDILCEEEKQQLMYRFNDTGVPYPRMKTVNELFEAQVERTPWSAAVVSGDERLTYKALDEQSDRLANYLRDENGIVTGQPVGILMERSVDLISTILGILKAGGAYVPMSPSFPVERIKTLIVDAGVRTLISQKRCIKTLNRLQWERCGLETFLCIDSEDVLSEDEREENELMNRKLWDYVGETSVDEITGGGWTSSYTGAPMSEEEMAEYGDNIFKKLAPLLHRDMRVLEIGAASGISMYRIAPGVGLYYGTDLSDTIIEKNRKRIEKEGHQNIKLRCLPAHEISQLEERDFDLVIMNSVIQCFNGHNYLGKVIARAIDLMKSSGKGYIFIGDIMDQDLKEDLIADIVKFKEANKDKNYKTKTDWSEELFISRSFLEDLRFDYPGIQEVVFSGKIYTIENELTRFRYDALLVIDKTGQEHIKPKRRHRKQQDLRIIRASGAGKVRYDLGPDNCAYIIYTSGSTGNPKGVPVTHANLSPLLHWGYSRLGLNSQDRFIQNLAYYFDWSVWEIFMVLTTGGSLYVVPDELLLNPESCIDFMNRNKITVLHVTPAQYSYFVNVGRRLETLRYLFIGAEKLTLDLARRSFESVGGDCRVFNMYGPTECTIISTVLEIQRGDVDNNRFDHLSSIPIGQPVGNTSLMVLDRYLKLRPLGVAGELYIAGDGLARGYLNNPELTAEKFVENRSYRPYRTYISYKTGDLARWLPDGNIEFLGRIDHQVKIRGFRIELGEIESCLAKHVSIKETLVLDRTAVNGETYLCAYIVTRSTGPGASGADSNELRAYLSKMLPEYMIPAYFVPLDKMPLGSTGKVDVKALPSPGLTGREIYKAPGDEVEKKLVEIWSEVLGVRYSAVGVDDNFFDLGGHSLRATVLTSKIQKELDVKVPLAEIFKGPTVRELARYIRSASKKTYTAVEPVEKKEYYPLSSAQGRFYILREVTPESTAYNITDAYELEGFVDKETFENSLNKLIKRHEILRTSFQSIDGRPVQMVHEDVQFEIKVSRGDPVWSLFIRPFDLSRAPLLRVALVEISQDHHILLFDMHHIISDGTSMSLFFKEFMTLYPGGKLSPLKLQYKDFAQWQHDQLATGKLKKQQEYWLKRFPGELPVLNMPTDFPRPPVQSFDGDKFDFTIEKSLTGDLKRLIRETGTTLYMVLLAVFNVLLSRYTGQEDIVIGTTIAGRHHTDLQKVIGLLIETLVQINFPVGRLEFKTFLEMVKKETLEAHENQAYPFREIIRILGADNEVSRNPVFDAMLIVQNFEATEFRLKGLSFLPYQPDEKEIQHTSKVDFTIEAVENEAAGDIRFTLEYCTRLFRRETMERFARHFIHIIHEVVAEPGIRLADIEVIDETEKRQLLETFNDTSHKSGTEKPRMVLERFRDQAAKTPDRIAVIGLCQTVNDMVFLTYRGLNERAGSLADELIEKGVRPETIVAIMMESSVEMAIGIWGILEAGGAYLPIEPGLPEERTDYMLKDSGAGLLLTAGGLGEKKRMVNCQLLIVNCEFSMISPGTPNHSNHIAYIIYTSGTSGRPKGVMVEHRNLANYVVAVENEIHPRPDDTVLQQGSLAFDAFVEEFYPLLLLGGKVAIPGKMLTRDIPGLCQFIARHRVSMIASAPQMVNELNKALRDGLPAPLDARELLSSMRIVLVGGDLVKTDYIDKFMETAEVYNTYGPTESTVCATYYRCSESPGLSGDVPIGKPLAGYRIYIEDKYGNLSPIGVGGELCVAGPGVTRGYMNQVELTNEKFCLRRPGTLLKKGAWTSQNFLLNRSFLGGPGGRFYKKAPLVYKTGDLARWLADGNIEFLGRIDRQVKIRGYRIELAEIETGLTAVEGIKEAVVIDEARKSGDKYLAAYVVCTGTFDPGKIKIQLARHFPDYMIPTYIIKAAGIPWTGIGKVDRKRLPRPQAASDSQYSYVAPGSDKEKRLAEIWQQILEKERVGIDDNFFDLGGTSLDIIKLNTRIKEEFNKQIPLVSLFKYTTIRTLVQFIAEKETGKQEEIEILEAIKTGQDKFKGRFKPGVNRTGLEIAVIGMAGIFPGARDLTEFWENLKNGVETIHFFSDEELLEDGVDAAVLENPNYIKARGIIAGVEYFDASFFGYTPLEARIMDPQMRIFQQCVWHALEDAGYDPFSYNRRIGLYAGASPNFYWAGLNLFSNMNRGISGFMAAQLADKDFMCTHISYKLNLKGPSVSLQTACSTSLVAIHHAVQGLLHGECEMALAGGVSITYPDKSGYIYQAGMIFSSDGHNRTFDARATGSVFADGVAVVVLKSLEDAIADRDNIYAVIKGSAINNDGARKVGYTAPGIQGQMEVIRAAQSMAEVEPESITYIEAHGTATPLGDTVEIEALRQAFHTTKKRFCAIGTLKSNMGHLYSAAGAAGLIKTVLSLKHRLILPSLYFQAPNPRIDFDNSPFYVNTTLKEWKSNNGNPLRAGVSSFGIGGTNAHVILEEFPGRRGGSPDPPLKSRDYQLILLSARTPTALDKMTENLVEYFKKNLLNPGNHENPTNPGPDAAYTLQVGRKHFLYRRFMVASAMDPVRDAAQLTRLVQRVPIARVKEENRPIIFMFCGQGSQYAGMGLDLYRTEPAFRQELDRCFEILKSLVGYDVKEILYPSDRSDLIDQTEYTLPVVFSFEYALAKLLIAWGIRPTAMIGYSFGEYVAACLSGVFSLADALDMIVTRGQLIQETPAGKMTSVTLPEHQLKPLLNERLSIAIVNGPTCIVSGKKEDVDAFEKKMKQKRMICVPLNMSHAVHSPVMNPIRRAFEQKIKQFRLNKPQIPFISNVTASWINAGEVTSPGYWGEHLCSTVRFSDGLKELLKQENAIFIEIGPGRILGMMVRIHADKKPGHMILNTVKHPQENVADDYFLLEKLGQLWQQGQAIDWAGFYGEEKRRRVPLPGYPFEGKRYWLDQKDITFGGGLPVLARVSAETQTGQETVVDSLQTHDETAAPRSEMENVVARMWKELMGLEIVGIHDDFFQLNGSSLAATQIIARLMQEYDIQIPMNRFYEHPTVAHLAEVVEELIK